MMVEGIIKLLIEKYEKRKLSGINTSRKISYSINPKNTPAYFEENDVDIYNDFINQLNYFKLQSFIIPEYDINNKLIRIVLNEASIGLIYLHFGIIPMEDKIKHLVKSLNVIKNGDIRFNSIIDQLIDQLVSGKNPRYINLDNQEETLEVIYAVREILLLEKEITIRKLSIQLFNDSKKLEHIKRKVIQLLSLIDEYEVDLKNYNVISNPGYLLIKGEGIINVNNNSFDLSSLKQGVSFALEDLHLIDVTNVRNLITIENLTSFHQYESFNEIVIYTAGFTTSSQNNFIKKIVKKNNVEQCRHWGDIDLGGIRIYFNLVEKTGVKFKPYLMDSETLSEYKTNLKSIDKKYEYNLRQSLEDMKYEMFHDVITMILRYKGTLEQEIISFL